MTNNNSNVDNYVDCSSYVKTLNKSNNTTNNIIPTNWKKFGEVYSNKLEQPVFVCSICLGKADCINTAYTTSDGSAFWWHIQHQHISVEYETIDKISEEIRNFTTNGVVPEVSIGENNSKIAEPTDLNVNKIKENQIKLLEEFHENLVKTNVRRSHVLDFQKQAEQDLKIEALLNTSDKDDIKPNIKVEEAEKYASNFSNCNYYYDNETHTISDDDEDDDDDDDEDDENRDLKVTDDRRVPEYLKHNDFIEISDDDDEQDDVDTCPNSPTLTNEETTINDVVNTMDNNISDSMETNSFNLVEHMRSEEIVLSRPMTYPMHSINCIPTPDISPCESLTNQHCNTNLNAPQYNKASEDTQTNQLHHLSKQRARNFRPFQCDICGTRTVNKKNMEDHQQRVHSSLTQEFANYQFPHKRYHQVQRSFQNHQRNLLQSAENLYTQSRPFKCKSCKRRTKSLKSMKRHQILYHSPDSHVFTTQCGICMKRILTSKLKTHMLHHSSSGYKCDYCGVVYKQKYYLNSHISKFHGDRNFNSTPEYQHQLHANYNIPPSIDIQNDKDQMQQSSQTSYSVNSIPANLTTEEELRYQECEQIWKLLGSCNNVTAQQDL